MAGFWQPIDDSGANQHYYGPNGQNVADILNGKLLVYDPSNFNAQDPDVRSMVQKLGPQIGTAQDIYNATSPNAPGNGNGSGGIGSVLTDPSSLGLLGIMAGGVGALGGFSGLFGGGGLGDLSATDLGGGYSGIGAGSAPTGAGGGMSGIFDEFGNLDSSLTDPVNFSGGGTNSFFDPTTMDYGSGIDYSNTLQGLQNQGVLDANGNFIQATGSAPSGSNIPSQLKSALGIGGSGAGSAAKGLFNADGSLNLGGLLNGAASVAPGLLALNYASNQPGINVGPLQGILGQFGGLSTSGQQGALGGLQSLQQQESASAPGYVQSVTDPVQRNIAAGYGALQQSQALRGLGGSSFGDTSLANYMDQGNRTLANAGATAQQAAQTLQQQNLGMQGQLSSGIYNQQLASLLGQGGLANNIITQQNQAQKNKNDLFGRSFSAFGNLGGGGSGLNLSKLLGGG